MNSMYKKLFGLLLVVTMITVYMPVEIWATDGLVVEKSGASDVSEAPDYNDETSSQVVDNCNQTNNEIDTENSACENASLDSINTQIDSELNNGKITITSEDSTHIEGKVEADNNYDLASIRLLWNDGKSEKYIDFIKKDNYYLFSCEKPVENCTITAHFFSLVKWDGAVDISWYDPSETSFDISTPAQLAGLAAIVNGMVDKAVTSEYMIKDVGGRNKTENGYSHTYISTESAPADLVTPGDGSTEQVRDTVWRLPEVEHYKVNDAADDVHNDMLYRKINITADIDMGTLNWTPIGGKYSMSSGEDDPIVIDTRFQGKLDGNGHTITINTKRVSKLGYAYSMDIGFIGYLGGGVDYANGQPKDVKAYYKKEWVPSVSNLVIDGSVEGRRMVGGIVGRIGQTNYGVIVENCVNNAEVTGWDMRGCAGIVGAAWGTSIIRNCYNTGDTNSIYEEHGGIVGSNGYLYEAASLYNCYSVGNSNVWDPDQKDYVYDGREIGMDGNAFARYDVSNCYYIQPEKEKELLTGYCRGLSPVNKKAHLDIHAKTESYMKSEEFVNELNKNGNAYIYKEGSFPVLFYQTSSGMSGKTSSVEVNISQNGSINVSKTENIRYGEYVDISSKPDTGYSLDGYVVKEDNKEKNVSEGWYLLTGNNISVKAVFSEEKVAQVSFNEKADGDCYYVKVFNVTKNINVKSGDTISKNDTLRIEPVFVKGSIHNNKAWEYTGYFGNIKSTGGCLEKKSGTNNDYLVEDIPAKTIEISFEPKVSGKKWTSVADTKWYYDDPNKDEYTINDAKELAGVAFLCNTGVEDFDNITIWLGDDISLNNKKSNSGDEFSSYRNWIGIGTVNHPFEGNFSGKDKSGNQHIISNVYRNFGEEACPGDNAGLFGVTDCAEIRNVVINSDSYINDDNILVECGFTNGGNGGGIVGTAINTNIANCVSDVSMDKMSESGGIVGTAGENTKVMSCVNNGTFARCGTQSGGIVGCMEDSGVIISDCINNADISAVNGKIGGILGWNQSCAFTITNCVNNGIISANIKTTNGFDNSIGGIVGVIDTPYTGSIQVDGSINCAAIRGEEKTVAIGGIIGYINSQLGTSVTNSYNNGPLYCEGTSGSCISGIANSNVSKYYKPTIKNCYSRGAITVGEKFSTSNKGGVCGYGNAANMSNNYCLDTSVSAIGNTAGITGAVVNSATLKNKGYDLGAAYNNDVININDGYPILSWQDPQGKGAIHRHAWRGVYQGAGFMCHGCSYEICDACGSVRNYVNLEGYSTSYVKSFKVSKGKGCFTAKWKKQNKKTQKLFSGYQVRWSTDPGMGGAGYRNVGRGKASVKIKGARKTRYYVQVRTYTGGFYSGWSAMKTVVTK